MTIRRSVLTTIMAGATLGALAGTALAADIIEPTIIEAPIIEEVKPFGGWYIRGDVGYSFNRATDKTRYTGAFQGGAAVPGAQPPVLLEPVAPDLIDGEVDDTIFAGVGIGAHMGQYLRGDITADFHFNGHNTAPFIGDGGANPDCNIDGLCDYEFSGDFNAVTVLANAYVDMGTYAGITPYVGAGIGFAHVDYKDVTSTNCGDSGLSGATGTLCDPTGVNTAEVVNTNYQGESSLRLAWSLAAGAAYNVNDAFAVDAGYRFVRIEDGDMVTADGVLLQDGGIDMHQVRVGARYKLH